jgi:hypothetical protein
VQRREHGSIAAENLSVCFFDRKITYDVLLRAEEIRENEKKIFGWVAAGDSVQEITKKGGYF